MLRQCLIIAALLPWLASAAQGQQATLFAKALEAARENQWEILEQYQKELGDNFILQDYLDFHRLRTALQDAPLDDVRGYLTKYAESPLSGSMRRMAMEYYARQQDWGNFQAVSSGVPRELPLRCYYYQATLDKQRDIALQGAKQLWLSGQSRPESCDPLFNSLKAAGELDDNAIWQRLMLAAKASNGALVRYLRNELNSPEWQSRADILLDLFSQPDQVRYLQTGEQHAEIATLILTRLAEHQPEEARRQLPMLARRFALNKAQRKQISDQIAWFSTIRDLPENRVWLDNYLADGGEPRLLEQRARRAVIEQDWDAVALWIQRLPADQRDSARWRYWLARSHEARDDEEMAQRYYRLAAGARSFWGFLAAQHLQLPAALNQHPTPSETAELSEHSRYVLQRVSLLLGAGEAGHASDEWRRLLRQLDDSDQRDALAQTALDRGWPHLAIETALYTGKRDILDWRFPVAEQSHFSSAAEKHQIDSWLLMAVARRESAFNPQARSPVGAMGLMQLMPGTAKDMARQSGTNISDTAEVFDPALNIDLGSGYLAGLLKRYNNNRVLALAAYNAGPHRVDGWLDDHDTPFDVFIESIPFYETREYVQAVLAYRVILSRHHPDQPLLALLDERETARPYTPMQLATNQSEP
ncbi:transglycosylase SLT domain-containing protein [Alcanivorax sp. 1008]|uniref:transglycosylase SLT domain-containing protein n=1 Tax=Alcanivorax sp. 1008 TaxID=2816853 RepID=UPI001DBF55F5|nr:transglycosylase SLT domain-containing protein [Alcanivorax sp. 1008]MCC1495646.1 transglycosylase SLT domain-containing protein [Alcanivorax sp. 1008]